METFVAFRLARPLADDSGNYAENRSSKLTSIELHHVEFGIKFNIPSEYVSAITFLLLKTA